MSEAGHTPGPWEFNYFTKPDGSEIKTVQDVAETTSYSAMQSDRAELWGVSVPDESVTICYTGNGPKAQYNARLIAAAPELLKLLKDARGYVGSFARFNNDKRAQEILVEFDAAIAKAEVRS